MQSVSGLTRAVSVAMISLLIFSLCFVQVGCSSGPQSIASTIAKVDAYAKVLLPLAEGVAALANNPTVTDVVGVIQGDGPTLLKSFTDALAACKADPSASNFDKLVAGTDAVLNDLDNKLLLAAHIKDPESQRLATGTLGLLDAALHVVDGYLMNAQTPAAIAAHAAAHAARLRDVAPWLDKQTLDAGARAAGLDGYDRALQYAEALGF